MENIKPRDWLEIPRVDRISAVMLSGCEFVIGWGGEEGEQATYCDSYVSVPGSKPTAWVECVKLDGKWWDVRDIFSPTFCDQLNVALCALEDFSACAP